MRKITILGLNFTRRETRNEIFPCPTLTIFPNIRELKICIQIFTSSSEKEEEEEEKKGEDIPCSSFEAHLKFKCRRFESFFDVVQFSSESRKYFVALKFVVTKWMEEKKKKEFIFADFCSFVPANYERFNVGWQLFSKDGYCHLCEMKFRIDCEPETFHITILISRATFTLADDRWLASEPYGKCTCFTESLIECAGTRSFFFCSPLFAVMVAQRWEENYYTMWKIFLVQ